MSAIGARPGINNPGDLTVHGPSSYLYPGQNGVYASPNGLYFAEFPDTQTGSNALMDYVSRHIANGWNTLASFTNGYLGVSGPGTLNPYPQQYLAAASAASGLSPNAPLSQTDAAAVAKGLAAGEGTSSALSDAIKTGAGAAFGPGQTAAMGAAIAANGVGSLWGNIENFFERFGLIILGGVVIVVALWMLLSEQGLVPSPQEVGSTAIKAAALAA